MHPGRSQPAGPLRGLRPGSRAARRCQWQCRTRTDTTRGDVAFTVLFRLPQQDERGASPVQLAQARPGGAAERLDLRAVPVARADSECRTAGRAASTDMIWII